MFVFVNTEKGEIWNKIQIWTERHGTVRRGTEREWKGSVRVRRKRIKSGRVRGKAEGMDRQRQSAGEHRTGKA